MKPVRVAGVKAVVFVEEEVAVGDSLHWGNVQFKHTFIFKEETILSC